jgi:hypothetical protein
MIPLRPALIEFGELEHWPPSLDRITATVYSVISILYSALLTKISLNLSTA